MYKPRSYGRVQCRGSHTANSAYGGVFHLVLCTRTTVVWTRNCFFNSTFKSAMKNHDLRRCCVQKLQYRMVQRTHSSTVIPRTDYVQVQHTSICKETKMNQTGKYCLRTIPMSWIAVLDVVSFNTHLRQSTLTFVKYFLFSTFSVMFCAQSIFINIEPR